MAVRILLLILGALNLLTIVNASDNLITRDSSLVMPQEVSPLEETKIRKIEYLSDLICSFLNIPLEEKAVSGPVFNSWLYWITWNLGEKEKIDYSKEIKPRVEEIIAKLYQQHGWFVITSEIREFLNYLARHDIAVVKMVEQIKSSGRVVSTSSIINYLAKRYSDRDITELEDLFRYFSAIAPYLKNLLGEGSELFMLHGTGEGFVIRTVLSLRKELTRVFGQNFMRRKGIFTIITEKFNILTALKPYVEDLLGRKLNLFHPSGADFEFLRGYEYIVLEGLKRDKNVLPHLFDGLDVTGHPLEYLYASVRDGRRDLINKWVARTQSQLRIEARLLPLLERMAGHTFFDIMDEDSENTQFFRSRAAWLLKHYGLNEHGTGMSPQKLIEMIQEGSFNSVLGSYRWSQPLNFFVIENGETDNITNPTTFTVKFDNWSFINKLVFRARLNRGAYGGFNLVIRSDKGEEAVFRVEGLQADEDGSQVIIPIWSSAQVSWGEKRSVPRQEYLSNPDWQRWLDAPLWETVGGELVFRKNRSECRVVKIKDEITDWRKIKEIEIIPLISGGGSLSLDGIYRMSSKSIDLNVRYQTYSALDAGDNILIKARGGAKVSYSVNTFGFSSSGFWCPGFRDLDISGLDVLILGRYGDTIRFVVPQYVNNILEMRYGDFIAKIWDSQKASYIVNRE